MNKHTTPKVADDREHTLIEMIADYLYGRHGDQRTGIGAFKGDAKTILHLIRRYGA